MSSEEVGDVPASETDAWPLGKKRNVVAPVSADENDACVSKLAPNPGCELDSEEYHMGHKRRGTALIFNHANFKNLEKRSGTNKDCADLAHALSELKFSVKDYHDLTLFDLKKRLDEVAKEDHSDADCLVIAVLSHGDPGILHAKDSPYPVQELWLRFLGDKCPSLAGKPKIFIIQACRGMTVDKGVRVRTETDSVTTSYSIPAHSDILVAYSTVEGYYSWRNPREGSWFVQALVEELQVNGRSRDLLTLLTFVNRRVAVQKQSYVPHNPAMDQGKQIPAFTSMLTRLVYFR